VDFDFVQCLETLAAVECAAAVQVGYIFPVGIYSDRAKFELGHHNLPGC